jgi:tyrosine-specific transport protein
MLLLVLFSCFDAANAFSSSPYGMATLSTRTCTNNDSILKQDETEAWLTSLNMQQQQPGRNEGKKNPNSSLSAYTSEVMDYDQPTSTMHTSTISTNGNDVAIPEPSLLDSFIIPVCMASLMVTGNTVGAGMLVLPEVIAGPGPMLSFGVMIGAWAMCLTSGLTIAQVAIQEHESSGTEVPSSFKEFAEATLPSAANLVSGTSIFINTLIVAFDVFKAGQIGSSLLPPTLAVDGIFLSYIYSGLLVCLVSSQSLKNLSKVASFLVLGLFTTFAGILLPGLTNVPDPTSVLSMPPLLPSQEIGDGVLLMAPVVISVLVFQNIVPTITRLLDYDRPKVVTALVFGSFIPLLMYMAWAVTVLGGGIDISSASGPSLGALMTCFSLITVAGSTLGGSMSLSEEFEIVLGSAFPMVGEEDREKNKDGTFSLPSVAMPIGIALVLAQVFSSDITETLKIAGGFGSPILYGLIPVSMALMQQRKANKDGIFDITSNGQNSNIIPGGSVGLGALTLASTALIGTELFQSFQIGEIM